MLEIVPEILDLKYLYLEVNSKIYYNTNLAPSSAFVSSICQNNANKYAESSELNKYGARFKYSKFLKILDSSHESVTSNITTVAMRRDLRSFSIRSQNIKLVWGIHVKNQNGYNIKTSSFRIAGIQEPVYMSDLPSGDGITGILFFFTLPSVSSQSPTIVRRNVGFC